MPREASLPGVWELALWLQRGATVVCSAFNAAYFVRYPARRWRRRVSALALVLLNLAILLQALVLGWLARWPLAESWQLLGEPRVQFLLGVIPTLASALVAALILIQWAAKRRR